MRRSTTRVVVGTACVSVLTLAWPHLASAQGQGHGHAYGHSSVTTTTPSSVTGPSAAGSQAMALSGTGVRTFGSWLDDASVMTRGSGSVSLGLTMWRTPAYREVDLPSADTAFAVAPRVQVGVSVPYFYASEPGGPVAHGMGDTYVTTKIQLRDPATHGAGFAVTPMVQVMSAAPLPGTHRVSWALPGSVEVQRTGWRAYGSAGYFSRGSLFASGALEVTLTERAWLTGTISRSHSVHRDDLSAALGLAQTRTDVSGGVSMVLRPGVTAFGSLGRTISRHDANSTELMVAGGVSFSVGAAKDGAK